MKFPIVKAFVDGQTMQFWCFFCQKWHFHGRGEGHRSAHCNRETPFSESGYILKTYTHTELRNIIRMAEAQLEVRK
jgi:hypothetical protein